MKKISSIIPIRTDNFSFYEERLLLRVLMDLTVVETIVVDDGSDAVTSIEIENFCGQYGFEYIKLNTSEVPFSLSRARNAGIDAANCEWIVMEDADIVYQSDFYNKISLELGLIDETPLNFLTIPVIYLKNDISDSIFENKNLDKEIPNILSKFQFENPAGDDDNEIVESFSPATALFIARKSLLKRVGGYDENFIGWGGEDRDIAFRMLALNDRIDMLPEAFELTKPWNLNKTYDYEGWRAFYRLTGDYLCNKGLYGYHLYHPKLDWRLGIDTKKNINFAIEKAKMFYEKKKIKPRYCLTQPVQIVIGYNPYIINSYVLSIFDNLMILDDDKAVSIDVVLDKIYKIPIVESILFWNPYGSPWRLKLYTELRRKGFPVIVAERGALPNSYYFDAGGFCIESDTYQSSEEYVEANMQDYEEKSEDVQKYINDLRYGDQTLEKQNERLPVGLIKLRLGIPDDKKILFVPLQLSTDTVTNYYVEAKRSYADYLSEVKKLEATLPSDWVLVVKNHPLATEKYESKTAIIADNYHVYDLIEASSALALFNSGCGLIAMAFNKKVFFYGKCFYSLSGVNEKFISANSLLDSLRKDLSIDKKVVLKFYYYLLYKVYSFAEVENQIVSRKGANVNILKSIDYKRINFPNKESKTFDNYVKLNSDSILLGRFGKALYLKKKSS